MLRPLPITRTPFSIKVTAACSTRQISTILFLYLSFIYPLLVLLLINLTIAALLRCRFRRILAGRHLPEGLQRTSKNPS